MAHDQGPPGPPGPPPPGHCPPPPPPPKHRPITTSELSSSEIAASSAAAAIPTNITFSTIQPDPTLESLLLSLVSAYTLSTPLPTPTGTLASNIPSYCTPIAILDSSAYSQLLTCSATASTSGECDNLSTVVYAIELALEACATPSAFSEVGVVTGYLSAFWGDACSVLGGAVAEGTPEGFAFSCVASATATATPA
ncbi:hypothetical protein SAICODRAFT_26893 [Saitoella complicata NRRL Y-17804]|uniref:uncharacterized protein n=1 Tax=Saitoella complicata (strain BCRC 22490 / CBS 7301 / JCM 7358 / NBRC 10748 / NRRL Y-17804) TaxID=698492 RepID=UPI0008676C13|nr:uncharacterized protein SAICODRAFT_26893 [Saitoella complicata NRRL Y-17804]ODQ51129.1 hypothetical protein SAICODRAFT_26893 [Saitoella complicata NRRL Y-17804]